MPQNSCFIEHIDHHTLFIAVRCVKSTAYNSLCQLKNMPKFSRTYLVCFLVFTDNIFLMLIKVMVSYWDTFNLKRLKKWFFFWEK